MLVALTTVDGNKVNGWKKYQSYVNRLLSFISVCKRLQTDI